MNAELITIYSVPKYIMLLKDAINPIPDIKYGYRSFATVALVIIRIIEAGICPKFKATKEIDVKSSKLVSCK
ncbi:hypothetical protein C6H68_09515 [Photorhabdus luminescens]|nr:hypothetical protein C6H68_09515 [Photorhabdus luminescens]